MSKQQSEDNRFAGLRSLRTPETSEQPDSQTVELETVKATFYLYPSQPDDIAEWQLAVKRATGKRVEKSELIRYALQLLSRQFAGQTAEEVYADMQRENAKAVQAQRGNGST